MSNDTIASVAAECAAFYRQQGWAGDGSTYELGTYLGDEEHLAARLGRAPTRAEAIALERAIKDALDASMPAPRFPQHARYFAGALLIDGQTADGQHRAIDMEDVLSFVGAAAALGYDADSLVVRFGYAPLRAVGAYDDGPAFFYDMKREVSGVTDTAIVVEINGTEYVLRPEEAQGFRLDLCLTPAGGKW